MQLKFFGGAQEVGRSSILLKEESSLIMDYGIKVGTSSPDFPIDIPKADALLLSHAHIDHSGAVPMLYDDTYLPAFGTAPTLELSELLLNDSLKVARKEHLPERFYKRQISSFSNRYLSMGYEKRFDFAEFGITMHDAGHIPGSAAFEIECNNGSRPRRIVYTGDFKMESQTLQNGAVPIKCDTLIMESTYALRGHPDRPELVDRFIERVREVLERGGNVLLPAFAVGRSQELLAMLYKHGMIDNTYVDGMARTATEIILKYRNFISDWKLLKSASEHTVFVEGKSDRKDALSCPSIIITTAGMLNGGPIMDYLPRVNSKSAVLLTGYQVSGTNGDTLLRTGHINVDGKPVKVPAEVEYFDFSAHAGQDDLYNYVKGSEPSTVVCVHGDKDSSIAMADKLKDEGYDAYAPKIGETITLN
jgi:putative mRNA 3-end processing factor